MYMYIMYIYVYLIIYIACPSPPLVRVQCEGDRRYVVFSFCRAAKVLKVPCASK